jgi:GNAT superfamily N-acetyltransferase
MEKNNEKKEEIKIRQMSREEAEFAVEMASGEGWNPGIHDAEIFYETDPKGFFIAEVAGKPAGCASAVAYDDFFGFLGFFVVKPEFREKGIGMKLTQKCLEYLGDRNIGLDGVVENEKKYQKVMKFHSYYSNLRFEGKGGGKFPDVAVQISVVPFENLLKYDRKMFPAPRKSFLEKWIKQPDSHAFAALEEGKLKGYGVIRKCWQGYKIGPLFADNQKIAENIFLALRASVPDEAVYLDVPEPNRKAVELAEKYGMEVMFKTIRMYSKEKPDIKLEKVYGVTSFELG